jgi:hypothetical protein
MQYFTKQLHALRFFPEFYYCLFGGVTEDDLAERIAQRAKAQVDY